MAVTPDNPALSNSAVDMPSPVLSGRQLYLALISVCIGVLFSVLDTAIANVALPNIATDLRVGPADTVWIVNAYQLTVVMVLLPLSALGQVVGHRAIFVGGLAVFTIASFFCTIADSLTALCIARAFQGLGASGVMAVNIAIIKSIFPPNRLGRGLGYNALIGSVAFAIGPSVAAGILSFATWPWLFAINIPAGLAAIVIAFVSIPKQQQTSRGFDITAALLNAGAFGFLILGLADAAHTASATRLAAELSAGIVFSVFLLRHSWRQSAPMLPVDLFRKPFFALSAATACGAFATQSLAFVSLPFYFQTILHRSEVESGVLMTAWPVMTAMMGPIAGRLSDRYNAALLGGIGLAMLCIGMALFTTLPVIPSPFDITWRMAICGMGFGFFQSPNLRAIMTSAPPARSGGANGVLAMARLVGQTGGAALVALCFGISLNHGPMIAIILGSFASGIGCITSLLRYKAR